MIFRLFEEVKYGLVVDLKIFSRLLKMRQWLSIRIKWSESMKLLIKRVYDGLVKVMHVALSLQGKFWIRFLSK